MGNKQSRIVIRFVTPIYLKYFECYNYLVTASSNTSNKPVNCAKSTTLSSQVIDLDKKETKRQKIKNEGGR